MERRVAWCGAFRSVIGGTGRDAHPDLLAAADLVTEMTKIEHLMDAGRKGQQGIEW
jgi:ATP:corrinoid adenosyltransferase